MKKVLVVSDFIEGYPTIASVRYEGIMSNICDKYEFVVINDEEYGRYNTIYGIKNFKYTTIVKKTKGNKNINLCNSKTDKDNIKYYLINFIKKMKILQKIKGFFIFSKIIFILKNRKVIKELCDYIEKNDINVVFVSTPMLNTLYIVDAIKRKQKKIKVIIEIRDIINNDMYRKVYPKLILKKAEILIKTNADGIIGVSEGIKEYYENFTGKKVQMIMNGYDEEKFEKYKYNNIESNEKIIFTHVGAIYGGRNIKDLILALDRYSINNKKSIELNLVGNLDSLGMSELRSVNTSINKKFKINIIGIVSHNDALLYLSKCNYSVILTHKSGSDYAIPGKTFECIGASKPILAITEDRGLIELVDGKFGVCTEHNINSIECAIEKLINSKFDYNNKHDFSRKNQALKIEKYCKAIVKNIL